MFTAARYEAAVPENAPEGTPVVRVEAASPSGEPIMYTIVAGNTDEQFGLDYSTGKSMTSINKDFQWPLSHHAQTISVLIISALLLLESTLPLKLY